MKNCLTCEHFDIDIDYDHRKDNCDIELECTKYWYYLEANKFNTKEKILEFIEKYKDCGR